MGSPLPQVYLKTPTDQRTGPSMADKEKMSEIDTKKAEVRARLEAQAAGKKSKKGFMTPERKKKLRLLLRKKATEELKREQERKSAERRKVIGERCGVPKNLDNATEDILIEVCQAYYEKVNLLEGEKYDMEKEVENKDYKINELNIAVNDLRGKFIKPTLKKISKYENKFAKLEKSAAKFNFSNQLKTVKKKEFTMEDEEAGPVKKKPEWALGAKEGEEGKSVADASEANDVEANEVIEEKSISDASEPNDVELNDVEANEVEDGKSVADTSEANDVEEIGEIQEGIEA